VNDLIHTQAVVVAGTEAAGFLIERTADEKGEAQLGLRPIAHIRPDNSNAETRAQAIQAFQGLVGRCVAEGKDGALEVGAGGDQVEPQFCLVTLLRNEGEVVAASAVITRCRDTERAQQRLTSMQLVAGYFDLYTLKRTSEQARMIAQSHQHVLQLATAVATAQGFQAAAMNLCNELATRTGSTRVSLGWVKNPDSDNRKVKVKALSHTEEFDKRQELIVQLQHAMEECLDQEEVVQYEPDGTSSQNVSREHQALSRAQGGNSIISIPLRSQAEVIGVLTLEFAPGSQLGPQAATGLSVAADLLAPQLYDRHENDRWMITKVGLGIREGYKATIGPKYWLAKTLIPVSIALLWFVCGAPYPTASGGRVAMGWLFRPMYHVVSPFAFASNERRQISSPYDSFISQVYVRPGDKVKVGQPLFELDTSDLKKRYIDAASQAHSKDLEYQKDAFNSDITKRDQAAANIAKAERDAFQAQADLYKSQIDRSVVKADIDGEVLEGDLRDKKGTPVKVGDPLMTIGQPNTLRIELRVAENDIQDVHVGAHGKLATTALPADRYPFTVARVVPTAETKDNDSYFKVYGEFDKSSPDWPKDANGKPVDPATSGAWLPDVEGSAKVNVEPASVMWNITHRLVDFVRLKLWI